MLVYKDFAQLLENDKIYDPESERNKTKCNEVSVSVLKIPGQDQVDLHLQLKLQNKSY